MFFKSKKKLQLAATQNGECVEIDMVPDPVFSERLLGDGVAIIPEDNEVKSPVDGEVVQVFDTLHAYSIRSDDGLEILVHIGLNTVELGGKGFTPKVQSGDRVAKGEILCLADLKFIKENGYDIFTPIVITNSDELKSLDILKGKVVGGETTVMEYVL